jgi:hypothetical protein
MSLRFFVEAGVHGPIETGLIKPEIIKYLDDYSGIYTSVGMLHVQFRYDLQHCPRKLSAAHSQLTSNDNIAVSTPIQFTDEPPLFVSGLLRQLRLLEWSGLHKFLHAAYCDLTNIGDNDRQLLLSGVGITRIKIRMSILTACKACRNSCLLIWLATWLLSFRVLTKDSQYGSLLCQLSIHPDDKKWSR